MTEYNGIATTATGQGESISPRIMEWLEKRGISEQTATNSGVYTTGDGNETTIVFPSLDDGVVVNRKYRGPNKKFWQDKDGQKTFYNSVGLDLAILENKPLVIVEGEMDCLSVIESRYAWVVSIPDGAPAKEGEFYSQEEDTKFAFLWNNRQRLDQVKKIILAGDADEPGRVLNHELAKRLGLDRCKFIKYPDDCKDFNDVLIHHGADKVNELIEGAKNYPVVGLYKPDEFPPLPAEFKVPYRTHMGREHDRLLKVMLGKLMIVTGVPGHGKSEWADGLVLQLAKNHNWNICVCSTEVDNEEYEESMTHRYLSRPIENVGEGEPAKARQFYQDHFTFITNNTMDNEMELTLEKLVELAEIAIMRDNVKVLLLDPWNEIEHCRANNESETEYTGRAIRVLKRLARVYGILVIVVAHPAKPPSGKMDPPTMYSISGSAHWANKADYGIVIWRTEDSQDLTEVMIKKVKRHGPMGYPGVIEARLNKHTGKFEEI